MSGTKQHYRSRKTCFSKIHKIAFLFPYDEHLELTILRGGEKNPVGLRIKRHRLSPRKSLDRFHECILIRPVLANDGDRSFAVRIEDELGFRIERSRIDVISD